MFSSIRQKTCKCSPECKKLPTMGYAGHFWEHAPKGLKEKNLSKKMDMLLKKQERLIERAKKSSRIDGNELKRADNSKDNKSIAKKKKAPKLENLSHSVLLRDADNAYSRKLRNDAADENGDVICPLCEEKYNLSDKDNDGYPMIQCLHYIPRGILSLRFDSRNTLAGCSYCNWSMNVYGMLSTRQTRYREILVSKYGEAEVKEMELGHRKINKLTVSMLKEIILKYQVT